MQQGSVRIIGLGESPPVQAEIVDNDYVLRRLEEAGGDTKGKSAEDTEALVGIKTRWWSNLSSTEHALAATREAVADASNRLGRMFDVQQIGLVHSGGSSPDFVFPGCSNKVQGQMPITTGRCEARDISLACSSFVDALALANSRMRHKSINYGLVTVGETIGTRLNQPTTLNYTLWGDGGGAVLLSYELGGNSNYGILDDEAISDGQFAHWAESRGLGCHLCQDQYELDAYLADHQHDIHRYCRRVVRDNGLEFLKRNSKRIRNDRIWFVGHNANIKIQRGLADDFCIPPEQMLTSIDERGNTSSASIPITLARHAEQGRFEKNDLIFMVGFGAGMAMNFLLYRWG